MTAMSTPEKITSTTTQAFPIKTTAWSGPPAPGAHVHKPPKQVLKARDLVALQKVKTPHNGRTSVMRLPLMKQQILSHFSGCFEGTGQSPGEPYKFHLKPEHKPARHASGKFQSTLMKHSKRKSIL